MKIGRLLLLALAGFVLILFVAFAASSYWGRRQMPFQNAPKLISALQAFSRDRTSAGRKLPPEVSLRDLIRAGYLTTNDEAAFQGTDVTFNTQADYTHPQMILARARTPDGHYLCLLADGSVQQFSRSRYVELRTNLGQAGGAANRSQPIRTATNSTSAEAGSGH